MELLIIHEALYMKDFFIPILLVFNFAITYEIKKRTRLFLDFDIDG